MTVIASSRPSTPLFVNQAPTNLNATANEAASDTAAPHHPSTGGSIEAIKTGGTRSLGRHSDWMCYHDEADDPISSTVRAQPNEGQQRFDGTPKNVTMPSQNFMFFVPTTVVEQAPMPPDASSELWYGPTNLGSLLAARECVLEGKIDHQAKPKDPRSK